MSDLIDRQAVIDAPVRMVSEGIEWIPVYHVEQLPPAQPKRMKGRWTKAYDGYDGHVKCVQCFKTYDWDTQAQYYNFCPNCGAWMLEEPYKGEQG